MLYLASSPQSLLLGGVLRIRMLRCLVIRIGFVSNSEYYFRTRPHQGISFGRTQREMRTSASALCLQFLCGLLALAVTGQPKVIR